MIHRIPRSLYCTVSGWLDAIYSSRPYWSARPASDRVDVLLVEDDATDALLVREAMALGGMTPDLEVATDGQYALDWLHRRETPPRLVLLDLNLPGISGHQVLEQIRADERLRQLPVVVFSSSTKASDVEECLRRGANAFMSKPGDVQGYERVLERLRPFWTGLPEEPEADA